MAPPRKFCDSCFYLPTRIAIIVLCVFQGGILDYYLVHHNNHNWYAWIAGDVAVIFTFFVEFFISYRELQIVRSTNLALGRKKIGAHVQAGSFPLVYFAWLVYSVVLAVRVALIYKNFAFEIDPVLFFGTNMLKFVLAISAVVYLLLVSAHHETLPGSLANNRIFLLTYSVPFDIVDCVDVLSIFFVKESKDNLESVFEWAIIIIACINFILPVLPLMMLSSSHFGVHQVPANHNTLYRLMQIFLLNTPLLSLRILMWHKQGEEVSPLIVKNIVMILVVAQDLYELSGHKEAVEENEDVEFEEPIRDTRKGESTAVLRYNV